MLRVHSLSFRLIRLPPAKPESERKCFLDSPEAKVPEQITSCHLDTLARASRGQLGAVFRAPRCGRCRSPGDAKLPCLTPQCPSAASWESEAVGTGTASYCDFWVPEHSLGHHGLDSWMCRFLFSWMAAGFWPALAAESE